MFIGDPTQKIDYLGGSYVSFSTDILQTFDTAENVSPEVGFVSPISILGVAKWSKPGVFKKMRHVPHLNEHFTMRTKLVSIRHVRGGEFFRFSGTRYPENRLAFAVRKIFW